MKNKFLKILLFIFTVIFFNILFFGNDKIEKSFSRINKNNAKEIMLNYSNVFGTSKQGFINMPFQKYYKIGKQECKNQNDIGRCFKDKIAINFIRKLQRINVFEAVYLEDLDCFRFTYIDPELKNYGESEVERFICLKNAITNFDKFNTEYQIIDDEDGLVFFKYK